MDKPAVRWLAIEKATGDGEIQRSVTKKGESAREESRNLRCTRVYECRYGIRKARNLNRTRKEISECEVRAALIRTDSTGDGGFMYSWRGVLGTTRSGCTLW